MVFRDIVIVGGVLLLAVAGQKVAIRPLRISKLNTLLQLLLVGLTLGRAAWGFGAGGDAVLAWAVAASTLASGAAYVWTARAR